MITATYKVKFRVGGYPGPVYGGRHEVRINGSSDDTPEAIEEAAKEKAKREIADNLSFLPGSVEILEITRTYFKELSI